MPHGCFSSGGAPTVWATSLLYFARQVWVPWDFNSFYFILFGSLVTLQIGEIATCMHSLSNREPIAPVFSSSKLHLLLQTLRISSPFKSRYIPTSSWNNNNNKMSQNRTFRWTSQKKKIFI